VAREKSRSNVTESRRIGSTFATLGLSSNAGYNQGSYSLRIAPMIKLVVTLVDVQKNKIVPCKHFDSGPVCHTPRGAFCTLATLSGRRDHCPLSHRTRPNKI
jgi:hypothetical protein